ncbi:MAG: 16S rRNA (guanine(966)-N(2))-methyltransferase RsmD [Gemmatimonadota bacterium]|nr:16S rRNA (guanine(966)-N(2))-methyltransferase RsmD [Gemmatimonadota bacterium]
MIAGRYGGRPLKSAGTRGLRPTAARVREALFSILGREVEDARVLDLYAGTGALSIEALSRGAREAVCVERSGGALGALESNLAALGLEERVRVVRGEALAFCRRLDDTAEPFDLVFADPPYAEPLDPILREVVERPWWTRACVVEHAADREPSATGAAEETETRRYGDTALSIFWRE